MWRYKSENVICASAGSNTCLRHEQVEGIHCVALIMETCSQDDGSESDRQIGTGNTV